MKKLAPGEMPEKDPLAVGPLDFAWWLKDSALDVKEAEMTEEEIIKTKALGMLEMVARMPGYETGIRQADTAGTQSD